ncbi:hypothetical protein [Streptomyces sp. NPDC096095]|uniref:hypothetical protein n=1 Tax=Streptomyces sp. NPDC096095 TaxID=3155545 RepID=UPI003323EA66
MTYRPTGDQIAADAYAAYARATGNKNFQGDPMPAWADLPAPISAAWQLAAEAVRHRVEDSNLHFRTIEAPR